MLFVNASHPQHHRLEQLSRVTSVLPRSSADALFAVTHPPIVLDIQPQSAEGKNMQKCCLMVFLDWYLVFWMEFYVVSYALASFQVSQDESGHWTTDLQIRLVPCQGFCLRDCLLPRASKQKLYSISNAHPESIDGEQSANTVWTLTCTKCQEIRSRVYFFVDVAWFERCLLMRRHVSSLLLSL